MTNSKMRIRRGRPNDLPDLMTLEASCFEPERRDSPNTMANSLQSPHQEIWLGEAGGRLLGSLSLRFHPHTCRLYSIAVSPDARGKGIGKKFLELAEKRAIARNCCRIHLEADAGNKALLDWYQANGYQPIATLAGYYAPDWNAIRFLRKIPT